MSDVVLEISTATNDHFRLIDKEKLREISKESDLKVRNKRVWDESESIALTTTNAVDYTLVLDGSEDEASWAELWDNE